MLRLALWLVCICLVSWPAFAQEAKPLEPESVGVLYYLSNDHSLKPLPKEPPKRTTAGKGLASVNTFVQLPGPASALRLKSGKDLEFVVTSSTPENIHLYPFMPKGKDRRALVGTSSPKGFRGVSTQQLGRIDLAISKYGEGSYRLRMKAPEPGEYGFIVGFNAFSFGVDP